MLSRDDIRRFKRDGAIVVRNAFSATEAKALRAEVERYFERPQTAPAWTAALRAHRQHDFRFARALDPNHHSTLSPIYRSLSRQSAWAGDNELVIRPGEEPVPWLGARAPHLDFPMHAPLRMLANFVVYLTDVEERGGAFMYWPGSHHASWAYFREWPDDYLAQGARSQDQVFERLGARMTTAPVEFTGRAGDILIWHSLMFHSASVNQRAPSRIAVFGRWGDAIGNEPVFDFERDIWSYWRFD